MLVVLCAIITLISLHTYRGHTAPIQPQEDSIIEVDSLELKPFDPNTADFRTMLEAGIPRNVAVSLIKWREAGKIFRIKEDVALCYNMTDSLYFALEPYIIIGEEYRIKPNREGYTPNHTTTREATTERLIEYKPFRIDTATAEYLILAFVRILYHLYANMSSVFAKNIHFFPLSLHKLTFRYSSLYISAPFHIYFCEKT